MRIVGFVLYPSVCRKKNKFFTVFLSLFFIVNAFCKNVLAVKIRPEDANTSRMSIDDVNRRKLV